MATPCGSSSARRTASRPASAGSSGATWLVPRSPTDPRGCAPALWIVECKADRKLLGFCGLKRVNSPGAPNPGDFEVGWRLREDAWGQGFAKEAAVATLELAFSRFGAPHVVAL